MQNTEKEIVASLRLQAIPHIGAITAKKLIQHCGSPTAVFKDKMQHLLAIDGIGNYIVKALKNPLFLRQAETEYEYILRHRIGCLLFRDNDYPEHLRNCIDGPILLFKKGNIALSGKKIISVVGTRKMTSYGRAFCERFIAEIAPLDPVIVSGLAYGVDICIQKEALKYGLQTVGCLAHGLNQIYPKSHAKYAEQIAENGGFFTEFWSTSQPERENFLKRNRIIAGISEATVVIESAEKGGSLVTANLAHGYHRDVYAVPGRIEDTYSKGCNSLIQQQKAHMITSAADLIYLQGWEVKTPLTTKETQPTLFSEMNPKYQEIYHFLAGEGKQLLDQIALHFKLPVHQRQIL